MTRLMPPDGYGVIRVADKQWIAVRAIPSCTAMSPDVFYRVEPVPNPQTWHVECTTTRGDAVIACFLHQEHEATEERLWMEALAIRCELHPDRCTWYRDEIAAITGEVPAEYVTWRGYVFVDPYVCPVGQHHDQLMCTGPTIEDALREAVEKVYARQHACGCVGLVEADGTNDWACLPIYEAAF